MYMLHIFDSYISKTCNDTDIATYINYVSGYNEEERRVALGLHGPIRHRDLDVISNPTKKGKIPGINADINLQARSQGLGRVGVEIRFGSPSGVRLISGGNLEGEGGPGTTKWGKILFDIISRRGGRTANQDPSVGTGLNLS